MPRYRFTHPYPLIFSHLQHGINAIVHRFAPEGENPEDAPPAPPEGSTVVLAPGDEVETADEQDHAHLVKVSGKPTAAAKALPGNPQTAPDTSGDDTDTAQDGE